MTSPNVQNSMRLIEIMVEVILVGILVGWLASSVISHPCHFMFQIVFPAMDIRMPGIGLVGPVVVVLMVKQRFISMRRIGNVYGSVVAVIV